MRNSVTAWGFAPRSYDLQDSKQVEDFVQDYERTARLSAIKSHAHYFMKVHGNLLRKLEKVFNSLHPGTPNYKIWKSKLKGKLAGIMMNKARSYSIIKNKSKEIMIKSESTGSLSGRGGSDSISIKQFLDSIIAINPTKGSEDAK